MGMEWDGMGWGWDGMGSPHPSHPSRCFSVWVRRFLGMGQSRTQFIHPLSQMCDNKSKMGCPIPPALAPSTKEDALPLSGTPPTAKKYPACIHYPPPPPQLATQASIDTPLHPLTRITAAVMAPCGRRRCACGVRQAEEHTQRQMREPPSLDHLRALAGERMRNSPPAPLAARAGTPPRADTPSPMERGTRDPPRTRARTPTVVSSRKPRRALWRGA